MNEQKAVPFRYLTKSQRDIVRAFVHERKGAVIENVEQWSWLVMPAVDGVQPLPLHVQHIGVVSGPQQEPDA